MQILFYKVLAVLESHPRSPELLPPASYSHFVLFPGSQMDALTAPHADTDPWRDVLRDPPRVWTADLQISPRCDLSLAPFSSLFSSLLLRG